MYRHLAVIVGAAAILAMATLAPRIVNAGASSSAPSKYTHQARSEQVRADRQSYPITEYSSSSRRTPHHQH
jgi:hypothetical protein